MRLKYFFLILFIFISSSIYSATIKIAFIDSFGYQKYVTTKYKSYYTTGIKLASIYAHENGINLDFKLFTYNNEGLSILNHINDVKKWNPDLIIGPRDSNHFLMLKNKFDNTLVISPFATSTLIKSMGKNYYSMTYDDVYTSKVYLNFINSNFPKSKVRIISDVECKSCFEVAQNTYSVLKERASLIEYISSEFNNNIESVIKPTYGKDDIFLLHNNAHDTAFMMPMISNRLKSKITFIGGDGWGQWNDTEVGKIDGNYPYIGYHITPWSIEKETKHNKKFIELYKKIYRHEPKNKLTFIIFHTIKSLVDTYTNKDSCNIKSVKDKINCSFNANISSNYNHYKYPEYFVLRILNKSLSIFDTIELDEK